MIGERVIREHWSHCANMSLVCEHYDAPRPDPV